jgi:hypothetical protein
MIIKRKNFNKKDKIKMLLWCERHCCLCGKQCGIDIEIAHILSNQDNRFDNGIPVCYDCHSKMGMYNELHPKGNKISPEEIKQQRELIYEKFTSQYIVPLHYVISNTNKNFPDINFTISNLSNFRPIRVKIKLIGKLNNRNLNLYLTKGLYTGEREWNLNPQRQISGHFMIQNSRVNNLKDNDIFEIRIIHSQIDVLGREHTFLEDGYIYNHKKNYWYFNP